MSRLAFVHRERGQTMAKYSVVLGVIVPAIIATLLLLSDSIAARIAQVAGYFT